VGDTQTRGRGEWSYPDPTADVDLGKPEIPPLPDDPNPPAEPNFPGGGPTDTRSGWDYPHGTSGPRGEERPYAPPGAFEASGPSAEPAQGLGGDWFQVDPPSDGQGTGPSAPTDRPQGMSNEEFRKWREAHPTALDKANTQTDVT
jgi:hypothetical protein